MIRDLSAEGFLLSHDEAGYRLEFVMPDRLKNKMSACMLLRGAYMDGTAGIPSRITQSISMLLNGAPLVAPWQVHGTAVVEARPIWALPQRVKADGVHLDASFCKPGKIVASLRFADCSPIVLASDYPNPWVMILHSGFQGTTKNIFQSAWRRALAFYGKIDVGKTYVWIGPSIGRCCYSRRVDDPSTVNALTLWSGENAQRDGNLIFFDIHGEIRRQVKNIGIPAENVFRYPFCTSCNYDIFYSYRSGDIGDRMTLLASLK